MSPEECLLQLELVWYCSKHIGTSFFKIITIIITIIVIF